MQLRQLNPSGLPYVSFNQLSLSHYPNLLAQQSVTVEQVGHSFLLIPIVIIVLPLLFTLTYQSERKLAKLTH